VIAKREISQAAKGRVFASLAKVPTVKVGVVFGCSPTFRSGASNPFFCNRMRAATELISAGKVEYLLVSGDNHSVEYDEPTAMRDELVRLDVPRDRIVLDYAGFSTLDTVVRAKEVFGLRRFCVVTQADHARRAVYIALAYGIDAFAYEAGSVRTVQGWRTSVREIFARVRTIIDVTILSRRPSFLGPAMQIGEGAEPVGKDKDEAAPRRA
jgi:SanA protein